MWGGGALLSVYIRERVSSGDDDTGGAAVVGEQEWQGWGPVERLLGPIGEDALVDTLSHGRMGMGGARPDIGDQGKLRHGSSLGSRDRSSVHVRC